MTTNDASALLAMNEPVALSDYDPGWPELYGREAVRIRAVLGGLGLDVEHIGSTAVRGMRAKPSIDILVGTAQPSDIALCIGLLQADGYYFDAPSNRGVTGRQWLIRHCDGRRTHHVHLVVMGSEQWRTRIGFRDALRSSRDLQRQYLDLKEGLARRFRDDRSRYSEGKSAFIARVLRGGRPPEEPGGCRGL